MAFNEPGAGQVEGILAQCARGEAQAVMSAVNSGEMLYILQRRFRRLAAGRMAARLDVVGVQILSVDRQLAERAAGFKVEGRVSYADCYAIASAELRDATVVTGDPEFRAFENRVRIEWLPQRPRP